MVKNITSIIILEFFCFRKVLVDNGESTGLCCQLAIYFVLSLFCNQRVIFHVDVYHVSHADLPGEDGAGSQGLYIFLQKPL